MVAAPAVMAQSADQQQAAISDTDLKTFALAAKDVQKINQDYVPAYQAAQTDEQRTAIQQEAMGKMAQSVKDKGMSVEKYNQIVSVAQADPEIARKVDSYAQQAK
jgi:GTP1/Obg family GTP-binding protein